MSHFKPSIQVNEHYNPILSSQIFGSGANSPYLRPPNYVQGGSNSYHSLNLQKEVALFQPLFQQNLKAAGPQSAVFTYNNDVYTVKQPKKASTTEVPSNYAYFHIGNPTTPKPKHVFKYETTKNPFIAFSTVGGFFNNIHSVTQATPSASAYISQSHVSNYNHNQDNQKVQKPSQSPVYDTDSYFNYNGPSSNVYYNPTTTPPPPTTTTVKTTTTTPRVSPNILGDNYYSHNPYVSNYNFRNPSTLFSYSISEDIDKNPPTTTPLAITTRKIYSSFSRPETTTIRSGYYITKSASTQRASTQRPDVFSNLDFNRFVDGIRDSHLTQIDPNLSDKLQKIRDSHRNITAITKSTPRPFGSTIEFNSNRRPVKNFGDEYYDDEEEINRPHTTKSSYVKPYNAFIGNTINSNLNNKLSSKYNNNNLNSVANNADDDDDEYYYEDEDNSSDYEDDDSYDDQENRYPIPTNKSKFMPMTETMAPRPLNNYYPTSTRPTFSHSHLPITTPSTITIPPIITFPEDDIQKMIKPHYPRYLNQSTLRPYTQRTRLQTTPPPITENYFTTASTITIRTSTLPPSPTTTTRTTTRTTTEPIRITTTTSLPSRTTRKVYTVRPNRGRGAQRWRTTTTKRPHLTNNNNLNNWELDEKLLNR